MSRKGKPKRKAKRKPAKRRPARHRLKPRRRRYIHPSGRGPGRPEWEPNKKDLTDLEQMASEGLDLKLIAVGLGISYETLNAARKKFSQISQALDNGTFNLVRPIAQKVITVAKSGKDMRTSLSVLRAKGNWRDRVEITTPTGEPLEFAHTPRKKLTLEEQGAVAAVLDEASQGKREAP